MGAAGDRRTHDFASLAVGLALAACGCAGSQALRCSDGAGMSSGIASTISYTIACPDVLELAVGPRPDLTGRTAVEPDGTVPVGPIGRLRVEGLNADEAAEQLASALHLSRGEVQIRVVEYASRQVFLCGPQAGHEKAVPYQGPETVVTFLRRTGGLSRDAEPGSVHVVRSNVAAGRRPEVFPVDLKAILTRHDEATDVRLEPYDQVYVGESARSNWMKYLPPWLQFGEQSAAGSKGKSGSSRPAAGSD
jgi:protein involved in polysaccharide export with SLBB domain